MAEAGTLVVRAGPDAAADEVHWLPVKTSYTGPCNAGEFFNPTPDQDERTGPHMQTAQLRGRCLKGVSRPLPPGYAGIVAVPGSAGVDCSAEERVWFSSGAFGGLTYWCHDALPAATDWQARCLDWLLLADKVQASVTLDVVNDELQRAHLSGQTADGGAVDGADTAA